MYFDRNLYVKVQYAPSFIPAVILERSDVYKSFEQYKDCPLDQPVYSSFEVRNIPVSKHGDAIDTDTSRDDRKNHMIHVTEILGGKGVG